MISGEELGAHQDSTMALLCRREQLPLAGVSTAALLYHSTFRPKLLPSLVLASKVA